MRLNYPNRNNDHSKDNYGIDKEQWLEKESNMRDIISKFLKNEINIYEMKQRLQMLEKEEMDLV